MMLNTEKPKHSTKKLLELINQFSEGPGYKINIQKVVAFLYANDESKKWRNSSHNSHKIKYLGVNLTKQMKDLQWKLSNIDDSKQGHKKWKDILC